jgi:UPF0716 protein FxsA
MLGLLALLFLVVPFAELYVIVQVTHGIGVPETILLLIGISFVGAWLAKVAGIGVLNRFLRTVRQGKVPDAEAVDGALVLLAGALMITPGFLSDCVAILLLLPPSRAVVRHAVLRRIRAGGGFISVMNARGGHAPGTAGASDVWDVEGWEDPPAPPDRPGLGA